LKYGLIKTHICLLLLLTLAAIAAGCLFRSGNPGDTNSQRTPPPPTPRPSATKGNTNGITTPTPTPSATTTPAATTSPTRSPDIDEISESLPTGNIAFNKPESMQLDKTTELQLVLSPTKPAEELSGLIEGEGPVQTRSLKVSDYMEATLYGENFTVTNPTQRKLVSKSGVTEWRWDVTPTKAGKQKLHLILNAIVNYADGEKPLEIRSFHEAIEVNVTIGQRLTMIASAIGSNMGWLWPGLFIPAGLWLWNLRKKKNTKTAARKRNRS
jgi:hypothetical protein